MRIISITAPAIIAILFFTSCAPNTVQLFITDSKSLKSTGDTYVWENDTIGIEYSFWENRGIMAFSIYNKLNKPLYIDWKKSNYISNSNKFNYWADEAITKSVSASNHYIYTGTQIRPFISSFGSSKSVTSTITTKPERITFLPPKSFFYVSKFFLINENFADWESSSEKREEQRNDQEGKKTIVLTKTFTSENSPIDFRNFLTFSMSEDFSSEFYIDNAFYVKEIREMDERHFSVRGALVDMVYEQVYLYKKGTSFYRE